MTTELEKRIERIIYIFPEVLKKMFQGITDCDESIPMAQRKVLHFLGYKGKSTMSEISSALDVEMSTTTVLVDALVEKDQVDRQRDKNDRRVVIVQLTKKGQENFKKLKEQLSDNLGEILKKMSEEKQKHLVDSFEQLYKILNEVS